MFGLTFLDETSAAAKEKLRLAKTDDERFEAIDDLWRQWHGKVGAWLAGRYPGLIADHVATATNQAFQKLYEASNKPNFDSEKPERLLFTIAQRGAIDLFRSQKAEKLISFGTDTNILLIANHPDPAAVTATEHAELADVMSEIRNAIAGMPMRQRQLAQLLFEFSDGDATAADVRLWFALHHETELSFAAANRSLQEVKRKLRAVLLRYKNELH